VQKKKEIGIEGEKIHFDTKGRGRGGNIQQTKSKL
jgi:hypothetical protein